MSEPEQHDSQQSPGGTLYIVSAPSGAGKTSLVQALVRSTDGITVSVSHTTRARRPAEEDGVNYHYVDRSKFQSMLRDDLFLEHAQVFDHLYGTSRDEVTENLAQGTDVVLEIDWQGARQARAKIPGNVGIFILPPSRETLEQRLRARAQDDDAVIERRMRDAIAELGHYEEFDYLVVNDDFEAALSDLKCIVRTVKLRCAMQRANHCDLLRSLLDSSKTIR